MELIRSNKGGVKLCLDGYIYTKKKLSTHVIRWKCSKETSFACKGRLTTDLEVKSVANVIEHSHPADPDATAALMLRSQIKETARLSNAQPSEILAEVLQGTSENILSRLGNLENIRRDIRRQKQQEVQKGEEKDLSWPGGDDSWSLVGNDSQHFLHQENNSLLAGPGDLSGSGVAASANNDEVKHEGTTPVQGCSDSEDSAFREPLVVIKSEDVQIPGHEIEGNDSEVIRVKKKRKVSAEVNESEEDLKVECLRLERKKLSLEIERIQSENQLRKEKLQLEIEKLKEEREKIVAEKELVRLSVLKVLKELNNGCKSSDNINGLNRVSELSEQSLNSNIVSELEKFGRLNTRSENLAGLNIVRESSEDSEGLSTLCEASGNMECQ